MHTSANTAGSHNIIEAWSNQTGAEKVTTLFQEVFGGEPDGVWAAPGRVNLIGEHTDYNEGLCLPIALEHRTFAAIKFRDDDVVRIVSQQLRDEVWEGRISDIGPLSPKSWAAYAAGPVYTMGVTRGFDAAIDSCVPFGAGLSSSAAIECVIAIALAEREISATENKNATELSNLSEAHGVGDKENQKNSVVLGEEKRKELVQACIRAENEVAGAATGGLDQTASLLCTAGNAIKIDCQSWENTEIPFDLSKYGLQLLIVDTKAPHSLNDGQYAARRQACEEAAAKLGRKSLRDTNYAEITSLPAELLPKARHVVSEIDRVQRTVTALQNNDLEAVGPLFYASHVSLRDDYEVSCPELDLVVSTAQEFGALGARMTGGGFGGSAIVLVDSERVSELQDKIGQAYAEAGFNPPAFLVSTAGGGAERIS
ncbi:MAG: galactokinase family protein [Arcanobacterium sp.]|nr:galactokinase family protein [Arcanobacterium sp.]